MYQNDSRCILLYVSLADACLQHALSKRSFCVPLRTHTTFLHSPHASIIYSLPLFRHAAASTMCRASSIYAYRIIRVRWLPYFYPFFWFPSQWDWGTRQPFIVYPPTLNSRFSKASALYVETCLNDMFPVHLRCIALRCPFNSMYLAKLHVYNDPAHLCTQKIRAT